MRDSKRFQRLSKEGSWVFLGQAMSTIGALVGVRLLTELLDPAAYGELALGLTVATLVNQTIFGPLGGGVVRLYAPAAEAGNLSSYLGAARRLVTSASVAVAILLCCATLILVSAGRPERIAVTAAGLVFAVLSGYSGILNGIQSAARRRAFVAIHQGLDSWTRYLVAAVLITWLGGTATIAIAGYSVALLFVLSSQVVYLRGVFSDTTMGAKSEQHWRRQIWMYSWPMSTFGLFTWFHVASDRWSLQFFTTPEELGLYSVLFQLGYYPISTASGLATQFLAPILFERAGDATDALRNRSVDRLTLRLTGLTIVLTALAFVTALVSHRWIFSVLVAKEYAAVSWLLPWVIVSGGVWAAGQTVALNLMSRLRTESMMAGKIITALVGVALNVAGARWHGKTGVVVAGVLFSVFYLAWMTALMRAEGKLRATA